LFLRERRRPDPGGGVFASAFPFPSFPLGILPPARRDLFRHVSSHVPGRPFIPPRRLPIVRLKVSGIFRQAADTEIRDESPD